MPGPAAATEKLRCQRSKDPRDLFLSPTNETNWYEKAGINLLQGYDTGPRFAIGLLTRSTSEITVTKVTQSPYNSMREHDDLNAATAILPWKLTFTTGARTVASLLWKG